MSVFAWAAKLRCAFVQSRIYFVIKKTLFFAALFILSLLGFLVATLPANIVWYNVLEPYVVHKALGLKVSSVQGTVWSGKAQIDYQRLPFIIDWDVKLSGLLGLKLPLSVDLHSQAGDINIYAEVGLGDAELILRKVDVDLSQLTPLVKTSRIRLDGQLLAKNVRAVLQNQKLISLVGLASWSGGDIAYPAGREIHERTLPSFHMQSKTDANGEITLGIRDSTATFDVISLRVDTKGVALVKVARRLLDLSDEAWPVNSRETDIVFKVKKAIY